MELVASVIFMSKQTQENAKYLDGRVQLRAEYICSTSCTIDFASLVFWLTISQGKIETPNVSNFMLHVSTNYLDI